MSDEQWFLKLKRELQCRSEMCLHTHWFKIKLKFSNQNNLHKILSELSNEQLSYMTVLCWLQVLKLEFQFKSAVALQTHCFKSKLILSNWGEVSNEQLSDMTASTYCDHPSATPLQQRTGLLLNKVNLMKTALGHYYNNLRQIVHHSTMLFNNCCSAQHIFSSVDKMFGLSCSTF